MIIADSDVLIDFLRGKNAGARRVAAELTTRSLCTTAITAFEVRSGAHSARQRKAVEALLAAVTILPLGADEARVAAELRQRLADVGQAIGMADYLIAAICLVNDGVLLTRNRKHFERVAELKLSGVEARD